MNEDRPSSHHCSPLLYISDSPIPDYEHNLVKIAPLSHSGHSLRLHPYLTLATHSNCTPISLWPLTSTAPLSHCNQGYLSSTFTRPRVSHHPITVASGRVLLQCQPREKQNCYRYISASSPATSISNSRTVSDLQAQWRLHCPFKSVIIHLLCK